MIWTAICVILDGEAAGDVFTFSFTASHDKGVAFGYAQDQTTRHSEVIAIIPGDHPAYAPSLDS